MAPSVDDKDATRTQVRRATRGDIDEITGVLARAFYDDPVAMFMFPSDKRRLR